MVVIYIELSRFHYQFNKLKEILYVICFGGISTDAMSIIWESVSYRNRDFTRAL